MIKIKKGQKHTLETKEKCRLASTGKNNAMYGKTFTKVHRKNISEGLKNMSEKTKRKRIDRLRNLSQKQWQQKSEKEKELWINMIKRINTGRGNPMYGKHHSDEVKEFMSKLNLGRRWNHTKKSRRKIREKVIERYEKLFGKPLCPNIGEHETTILSILEENFTYKILRQHRVAGYFLDGYCPALDLAIEIDEGHHFNESGNLYPYDIRRQNEIEKELNCQFLRIEA